MGIKRALSLFSEEGTMGGRCPQLERWNPWVVDGYI